MAEVAHLNAAGAALPLPAAQEAALVHMREEARVGPHWAADAAAEPLAETRATAARLLGAPSPANVAFGETATRLWAQALSALPLRPGARILLARCEWGGNALNARRLARERGASVEVLPADARGRVELGALAATMDERVAALCIPAVSSGLGTPQPVAEAGRLPRPEGCLFLVDAAQAAGQMPAGLELWKADVVTAPARKWLRGPRGQAAMALSDRALALLGEPPLLDLAGAPWVGAGGNGDGWTRREDAGRFESYEFSAAGRLGFGAALAHADRGLAATRARIAHLLGLLHAGLSALPGVEVFEDASDGPAFLTFVRAGEAPGVLAVRLRAAGVAIAAVGAGNAPFEFAARGVAEVCRVAPHAYTRGDEVARFLEAVADGRVRA